MTIDYVCSGCLNIVVLGGSNSDLDLLRGHHSEYQFHNYQGGAGGGTTDRIPMIIAFIFTVFPVIIVILIFQRSNIHDFDDTLRMIYSD